MPFFRDEFNKEPDEFLLQRSLPDAERIENAKWLHYCGWHVDAFHIIHSLAKAIDAEETYEEVRFDQTNEEGERAAGGAESSPDAGHGD